MQILRRRERPSRIEQIRLDPIATDAALLLRQAERAVGTGDLTLTARAGVIDHIAAHAPWIETLHNRTGRTVRLVADPAANGAGHAQYIPARPPMRPAARPRVQTPFRPRLPRTRNATRVRRGNSRAGRP